MKKISIVVMAVSFALSANVFAGTKHQKHMHHAKPVASAKAAAPVAK